MEISQQLKAWSDKISQETRIWMRYLTFRPWIEDKHFVDIEASDSFGVDYASLLSKSAYAFHAKSDRSEVESIDSIDWPAIGFATCFEHTELALAILESTTCNWVIGAKQSKGWSAVSLMEAIEAKCKARSVLICSQSDSFPHRIEDSTQGDLLIAIVGAESIPVWPRLGLAMPTVDSPNEVREAILSYVRSYPGLVEFAIVANGSSSETNESLAETASIFPSLVTLFKQTENTGYGQGANRGMEHFAQQGGFDYLGVTNDDVIADVDCLCELASAMQKLETLGCNPGVIGPVSNQIHGAQCVEIDPFSNYHELKESVRTYRERTASSVTQVRQLRGLLMLMHPKLIEAIGGFDPVFGIGNFEDDDHNLRTHLAGYSIWIGDGAFLFHHGSTTFRRMSVDYEANIRRNAESMASKWGLERVEDWIELEAGDQSVASHVPLDSWRDRSERVEVAINGESVDLISQASDIEFAAWVVRELGSKPRSERKRVIEALHEAA